MNNLNCIVLFISNTRHLNKEFELEKQIFNQSLKMDGQWFTHSHIIADFILAFLLSFLVSSSKQYEYGLRLLW